MSLLMCPCVYVPKHIVGMSLCAESLAAMVWIISRNLTRVNVDEVKDKFSWGTHVWQKVSKELRDKNLITLHSTGEGNRLYINEDQVLLSPKQQDYLQEKRAGEKE